MLRHTFSRWILRGLGLLLVTAAMLKGHELLTLPVANKDLWSYRPFLILQVELELALGLWLLSGLFKRLTWKITLACFGLFCNVTLYKALTGAASCGCFGRIHVDPWVTLLAIDVPAVCLLLLFPIRKSSDASIRVTRVAWRPVVYTVLLLIAGVGITTTALVLHEPARVTAEFEVLEPGTWVDKPLPIMAHMDQADQLQQDNWVIMLFHHDCPDCEKTMPAFEQIADNFVGNEDILKLALVEIPPYGYDEDAHDCACLLARMDRSKKWMVTTPSVLMLTNGVVRHAWEEGTLPTFEEIFEKVAALMESVVAAP